MTAGGGCPRSGRGTLPPVISDNQNAQAALTEAYQLEQAGQRSEARAHYEQFKQRFPADPLVPLAELGLGRIDLKEGQIQSALSRFERLTDHPDPGVAERARYHRGIALHEARDHQTAVKVLSAFLSRTQEAYETEWLLRALASSAEQVAQSVIAVRALDQLMNMLASPANIDRSASENPRTSIEPRTPIGPRTPTEPSAPIEPGATADNETQKELERISGRISRHLDAMAPQDLATLYESLPRGRSTWPEVAVRSARQATREGDRDRARDILEEMRKQQIAIDPALAAMVEPVTEGNGDPRKIGAILPLSGRGREVGQLALRGLQLAVELPEPKPFSGPRTPAPQQTPLPQQTLGPPELIFRDGAGDPARTLAVMQELIEEHRVIAIVGPLDSAVVPDAARLAEERGIPLITLAPQADITEGKSMVFRLSSTPQAEVRTLVAQARREGARSFAALQPNHGYGRALRAALEQEVATQGGIWSGSVDYDAKSTSFREPLEELKTKTFDALLIPDSARRVALIAPALAAVGLWSAGATSPTTQGPTAQGPTMQTPTRGRRRSIRLLLPSAGWDDHVIQTSGRYVQGALVSRPFHASASRAAAKEFSDWFETKYGTTPDSYAASAFDAARLLRTAVARGAVTRPTLAAELAKTAGTPTAGPSFGFSSRRTPNRATRIWRVQGDQLERVGR